MCLFCTRNCPISRNNCILAHLGCYVQGVPKFSDLFSFLNNYFLQDDFFQKLLAPHKQDNLGIFFQCSPVENGSFLCEMFVIFKENSKSFKITQITSGEVSKHTKSTILDNFCSSTLSISSLPVIIS